MKAAVLYGQGDVRVEEVPERALAAGEVRIRIEAALTCGTDLKVYKRGYHARMIVPPAVFGHEFAGVIVEVADDALAWQSGDRVVAANSAPCGQCFHCGIGQENLCEDLLFLNGAYAESIVVPSRLVTRNLLRLAPETSCRDAALVEPLACVVQGFRDLGPQMGEHVLVLGAGPIGLMFTLLARNAGCRVTVAGRRAPRLEAACRLGAERAIDVGDSGDVVAAVRRETRASFDAVFEAVGRAEAWEAAVQLVRKGGRVNFFGGCPAGTTVSLDTSLIHYSNLTLRASFHHTPETIREALRHIEEGTVRAADFVDGEADLDGLPALFREMAAGNRAIKSSIRVN
ncbi:MAG: zinc-dependent alcohol dehydrogenase [Limisphaerales bacterium]